MCGKKINCICSRCELSIDTYTKYIQMHVYLWMRAYVFVYTSSHAILPPEKKKGKGKGKEKKSKKEKKNLKRNKEYCVPHWLPL